MSYKIYIGVGHGGTDPGAIGNGYTEKELNLAIAKAIESELKAVTGIETKISRTGDISMRTGEKVNTLNAWGANFAIEVHHNAGGGTGFEIYCSSKKNGSEDIAKAIEKEIIATGRKSRGVKKSVFRDGKQQSSDTIFGMVGSTKCPSVLVEYGFIDNATDAAECVASAKIWATATAKGICKAIGAKGNKLSVGDTVTVSGSVCADSSGNGAKPIQKPTESKITAISEGKPYPYHCVGGGVYGWVKIN